MTWAVDQQCSSPGEKLVLVMLANYCNGHSGRCNPSHRKLAAECSMGVSTLKRHLAALADRGVLQIIPIGQDGVSLPNQYDLNLEGVGPNRAGGSVQSGLGVGPNRATNQESNQEIEPIPPKPQRGEVAKVRSKREKISFTAFLAACTEAGEKPIRRDDPIFQFAADIDLPREFLLLAWRWFARRHRSSGRLQKDWRAHFRDAVRGNWAKLWWCPEGKPCELTTAGVQLQRELAAEKERELEVAA